MLGSQDNYDKEDQKTILYVKENSTIKANNVTSISNVEPRKGEEGPWEPNLGCYLDLVGVDIKLITERLFVDKYLATSDPQLYFQASEILLSCPDFGDFRETSVESDLNCFIDKRLAGTGRRTQVNWKIGIKCLTPLYHSTNLKFKKCVRVIGWCCFGCRL